MKNKLFLMIASCFFYVTTFAQETLPSPEMADTFRSEGKIYVVIAVLAIVFVCIVGYLIYIDIKLKKLEK